MFIPLKYGTERVAIGTGEFLVHCPSCETAQWADVMVYSVYVHFWYIPILPNDKEAFVSCEKCGLKRYGMPFNATRFSNYEDVKRQYRHPWYTYIGISIFLLPFVIAIVLSLVG